MSSSIGLKLVTLYTATTMQQVGKGAPAARGMPQHAYISLCAGDPALRVQVGAELPEAGEQQRHVSVPVQLSSHLLNMHHLPEDMVALASEVCNLLCTSWARLHYTPLQPLQSEKVFFSAAGRPLWPSMTCCAVQESTGPR